MRLNHKSGSVQRASVVSYSGPCVGDAHRISNTRHPSCFAYNERNVAQICIVGAPDRSGNKKLLCPLRSDTLTQHQSDPRHRSNLNPMRGQNDDTNRVDFAARTPCGRCDRSSLRPFEKQFRAVSPKLVRISRRWVRRVGLNLDRCHNSDSGHAPLCGMNWSR